MKKDEANILSQGLENLEKTTVYFKKTYKIGGKTIEEWREYLNIEVSNELTLAELREVARKVIKHYQIAAYYKSASGMILEALNLSKNSSYNEILVSIQQQSAAQKLQGKKPLIKDVMAAMAEIKTQAGEAAVTCAKANVLFWKSMIDSLDTTRKLVETSVMSYGVEAKMDKMLKITGLAEFDD